MIAEPFDHDGTPLFPFRLEFAICCDGYDTAEGETQQCVVSPAAAKEVGAALMEGGRAAKPGVDLV